MNSIEARRLLHLSVTATPDEITKAYRKAVYAVHPDRHPHDPAASNKVTRLNAAYDLLRAPRRPVHRPAWSPGPSHRSTSAPPHSATDGPAAWEWFNISDAEAVGDPFYARGEDPLTDLVNDLRRAGRENPSLAHAALGIVLGVILGFEMYRKT